MAEPTASRAGEPDAAVTGDPNGTGGVPLRVSTLTFPVVGIGGSAGALPALLRLFEALPENTGMAFVVVLHLSPDHDSHIAEILGRATSMPVQQVVRRTELERNRVYVIAPGDNLVTDDGAVQPAKTTPKRRPSTAIDVFFRALAAVHRERAVCVVLSGTGSDGALGVGRVKEEGGLAIAQSPEEAEFANMPRAAIDTGAIDLVLPAAEIGTRLVEMWSLSGADRAALAHAPASAEAGAHAPATGGVAKESQLGEILSLLRFHTRHDFKHYKPSTVMRRIARRMQINGLTSLAQYRDFLAGNPKEAAPLLKDMLISVTNFFRDPAAFAALQSQVVPQLFDRLKSGDDLRVWVAGCATGEESYSVAMLLREEANRRSRPVNLQIFATDINEAALSLARRATYPAAIAVDVSASRLVQFFEPEGEQYRVHHDVRDPVLFAKHNLLGDPPFSRLDLICCRNVLIYLDDVAQAAALDTFSYALQPGGFLFLGNSESADTAGDLFLPVDKAHRIFRANPGATRMPRPAIHAPTVLLAAAEASAPATPGEAAAEAVTLQHQLALLNVSSPSVLIDGAYEMLHMSPGAAEFVGRGDGVPSDNLLASVAPDIRLELRTALFRAEQTQRIARARVERTVEGKERELAIDVHPLQGRPNEPRRFLVVFEPWREQHAGAGDDTAATAPGGLLARVQAENRELKAQLQDTLDRFAVSAEESRSANQELQAINEELRSASEELETSREELESMNEELGTVNYELRTKVEDATRVLDDMKNLMAASDIATVFVDSGLRIKRYTPTAVKLFHLIPADVGRPLTDIRSRLGVDICDDAATAFKELRAVEREVESVDGGRYLVRALPYRTASDKIDGAVLTFVDISELHAARERSRQAEGQLMRAIMVSEDFAVLTTDDAGVILTWNSGAQAIFGYPPEAIIGHPIDELFIPADREAGAPAAERRTALEAGRAEDERWHLRADGSTFFAGGVTTPLLSGTGRGFVKIARDVTAAKKRQLDSDSDLRDEKRISASGRIAGELKDKFLAVMSHELKQPLNLIQVNAELLTRLPQVQEMAPVMRIGETIQRGVAAQTKIVNDLLDLSRIQTGKLSLAYEDLDLVELTRVMGQAAAGDLEKKGIAFTMTLGAAPVMCHCDRVRVEQILWNLLGNAAKFTPPGGSVALDLREDGDYAKLSVTDTGSGIAPEFLPHAFDMFSQVSQPAVRGAAGNGGLGIGLALVDELVRAHGGRVEARSEGVGHGTTFVLSLPLQRTASAPQSVSAAAGAGLAGARVLAVDDDADALAMFALLLQYEGAVVDTAVDGKKALALLAAKTYDVLISDVSMSEMDGLQLVEAARRLPRKQRLLAIAVSGHGRDVDVRNSLDAGFDAHLSKPLSMAQLKAALAAL